MARQKTTPEEILAVKKQLLAEIGIEVPCSIKSDILFKKLKRNGHSRHRIVKYVLEVTESVGRRIDLKGNKVPGYTVSFDADFKTTVTKNLITKQLLGNK